MALGAATAAVSIVALAITLSFESRVCPNVYANDCDGRGTVAMLYWLTYVGPVLIASFALGPIHGRPWTSYLALSFAGLIGLGIVAAPTAIEDAHIDRDGLFAYVLAPIFLAPLIIAAVAGALARTPVSHLRMGMAARTRTDLRTRRPR